MIRLAVPSIEDDDIKAVTDILKSGYLVQGTKVAEFEKTVADYVGTEYAVAVSNCTAALHLSLSALDVRIGDIVAVTSYSWIATANVIELCGAQPVFADIDSKTFNIDPLHVEILLKRLFSNSETARRVKALLPVHTFGQMAQMSVIMKIADQYNLPVIEDAACALGASFHGKKAGTWGTMGCFSFHPRKAVTTGEGGIIVTNDLTLTKHLRALRNHGQDPPDFIMPGFNCRLTEFQAGLGLSQMNKLDRIIARRRNLAENYNRLLKNTPLSAPFVMKESFPVFQSYVLLLPENKAHERTELIQYLREHGIEVTIGTLHMPMTTYFRSRYGYKQGDFPIADSIFARSLTLPLHEKLSETEQHKIVETILKRLNL